MRKKLKIFIIAGEVSGDVLGEKIMRALGRDGAVEFAGIGGEHMRAAGSRLRENDKFTSLFPMSELAVMGFFEVLAHARTLTRRINQTADAIIKFRPDIVLTIDSPGFAKRVVKKVRQAQGRQETGDRRQVISACDKPLSINMDTDSSCCTTATCLLSPVSPPRLPKFYHIVAPQVWAWGAKRAKKFAKIFDRLYAFFDFEKPYFEKYGLPVVAVGHPIADGIKTKNEKRKTKNEKNIALIPGSRMSEVKKLLPIFCEVAGKLPGYEFSIPVVETTKKFIERETKNWCVRPRLIPAAKRYELFANTDIAVAASGTVSAELAIIHIPAIVVYRMNPLTEFLARIFVKTKWASLVNILLKKSVYPELLGRSATAENIVLEIHRLEKPAQRKKMISELSRADKMWHKSKPAADIIAADLLQCSGV
jgi:lipid-A-disaccharide synthase